MSLSGLRPIEVPTVYCVLYKDRLRCVFTNPKAAEDALLRMRPLYKKKKQKHLVVKSYLLREDVDSNPYNLLLDFGCLYANANIGLYTDEGSDSWTDVTGEVVVPRKLGWDGGKEIKV